MTTAVFSSLGMQLRALRAKRGWSQPALAGRLGRDRARISELERDLVSGRQGRDRLTLFAEICDAFDVEPVLVPRDMAADIRALIAGPRADTRRSQDTVSVFDELFVDLGDEEETS